MDSEESKSGASAQVITPDNPPVPSQPVYATAERPYSPPIQRSTQVLGTESNLQRNVRRVAGAVGLGFLFGAAALSGQPQPTPDNVVPTPISTPDTQLSNRPQVELSNPAASHVVIQPETAASIGATIPGPDTNRLNATLDVVRNTQQTEMAAAIAQSNQRRTEIAHAGPSPANPNEGNPQVPIVATK